MTPEHSEIVHVSDTALMVAACRAQETAREDGLVWDPFAAKLAGERGLAILRALPRWEILCFGIGIRIRFLDELVLEAINVRKVTTVLCLGAGLDSRPWRLPVSENVRWIEADFPAVLEYKDTVMDGYQPKCRLERIPADLNDGESRGPLFRAVGDEPALMITEGLLSYLPTSTVEGIASEAAGTGAIRYWALDLTSRDVERRLRMDSFQSIDRMRAPDRPDGERILEIAARHGWTAVRHLSYIRDALQLAMERMQNDARKTGGTGEMPRTEPPPPGDPSGVHLLGKA